MCPTHGIVPYDFAIGVMGRDKALDMLSKWGVDVGDAPKALQRAAKRVARPPVVPGRDEVPAGTVASLLGALRVETNPVEKRKLRARLRAAGHTGGLRG